MTRSALRYDYEYCTMLYEHKFVSSRWYCVRSTTELLLYAVPPMWTNWKQLARQAIHAFP